MGDLNGMQEVLRYKKYFIRLALCYSDTGALLATTTNFPCINQFKLSKRVRPRRILWRLLFTKPHLDVIFLVT